MIVLFKGAELRDTQKTQVIKRLASPQTSFGVRSSRIHFSPKSVRERWMRDERTSKDVWGELALFEIIWYIWIFEISQSTWNANFGDYPGDFRL